MKNSPLLAFWPTAPLFPTNQYLLWQEQISYMLKIVKKTDPQYIVFHDFAIHDRFFDQQGNCNFSRNFDVDDKGGLHYSYIQSLRGYNRRIKSFIEAVLEETARPVIIIIQSDEGDYSSHYEKVYLSNDYSPSKLGVSDILFRLGNFMAIRWFEPGKISIENEQSPINLFRIVMDGLSGSNLPRLPHRHFIHNKREDLFDVQEITDVINNRDAI
jgi:hypothetical protein